MPIIMSIDTLKYTIDIFKYIQIHSNITLKYTINVLKYTINIP
jgi:hypothetical protein